MGFGVRGSGFGVRGSGFGVRGSGFGVRGSQDKPKHNKFNNFSHKKTRDLIAQAAGFLGFLNKRI